jgi:hypothetical protein
MTQSQLQQIHNPLFQVTGGEMKLLGNQAFLVLGQDFQGNYFSPTATQTYTDEIQSFGITYSGATPDSLAITTGSYQAQNDQVDFRRRDYNLGDIVQSGLQTALEVYGGVFTPGAPTDPNQGQGYQTPIVVNGIGATQLGTYQQFFSQYSAPNIGLYDMTSQSMYTIFLGGIGLYDYNFATGALTENTGLPFVDDVTTLEQGQGVNGGSQEYEMPSQLPGLYGAEARFFPTPGLPEYSNGVIQLNQLTQPTTLGFMYGGILSTAADTTDQATQTSATNALFQIVLVPSPLPPPPTPEAANTAFVASVYKDLLGRAVDPGAQTWVTALNNGAAPQSIVLGIEGSTEYLTDQVTALYLRYLNRQPDPQGLQTWLNDLQTGQTLEQVAEGIVSLPEFFQDHGSTNSGYVTALYQEVLGRTPSAGEVNGWVAQMTGGATTLDVAVGFFTSTEYRTNLVDAYYETYLFRAPDAAGLTNWMNQLAQGVTDQEVLAGIFGSPEGFSKWS